MEFKYLTDFTKDDLKNFVVVPCKLENFNCVLIKNKFDKEFISTLKTDNLEVRMNTVVENESDKYYVHIIKANKTDLIAKQQFEIIYDYIFRKIINPIDDGELTGLINSLEDYFRITPDSDTYNLQIGVFGELLTVKELYDNGYKKITGKYHKNFYSKHDIEISDKLRLEIKTTQKKNRIHHFSHDQISRDDIDVYVVSMILEPSEKGTTLYDMFIDVIKLYDNADSVFELNKLMKRCGVNEENKGLVFSLEKAKQDMWFINAEDIPKLKRIVPSGVTEINYCSDCSFCKNIGIIETINILNIEE